MHFIVNGYTLRKPEARDVDQLYAQKNDPEVARLLGGFSTGYTRANLVSWVEYHGSRADEVIWIVAESESQRAVGHVGLYKIDFRIGSAEFAIMLGDKSSWGRGLGRACTEFAVSFGFDQLNLQRVSLEVLESNPRASRLYESIGFKSEGRLRRAQYKDGRHLDVLVMSVLREEWKKHD